MWGVPFGIEKLLFKYLCSGFSPRVVLRLSVGGLFAILA